MCVHVCVGGGRGDGGIGEGAEKALYKLGI